MELKALGNSEVRAGQLLTLYSSSEESADQVGYSMLFVLVDFNLSKAMAEYHSILVKNPAGLKTRDALKSFATYLVASGYVKQPEPVMVHLGEASRPPKRIIDEYKYQKNPVHHIFGQLKEEIVLRSIDLFTHEGHYVILMNPEGVQDEFRLDLSCNGEFLGVLRLGVVGHSSRTILYNPADLEKIRSMMDHLIQEVLPDQKIVIERITADFPPTSRMLLDADAYARTQTWLNRGGHPPWGDRVSEPLALAAEG